MGVLQQPPALSLPGACGCGAEMEALDWLPVPPWWACGCLTPTQCPAILSPALLSLQNQSTMGLEVLKLQSVFCIILNGAGTIAQMGSWL